MNKKTSVSIMILFCVMAILGFVAPQAGAADQAVSAKTKTEKINLNQATAAEISALPGLGEKKAEAIVEYRTQNGPFAAVEDLLKVKGIGEKLLEKIKPMIMVEAKGADLPKTAK
ncbi:MAG: helix-hairpin-helix domain-containing protein [bacterium]